MEGFMTADGGSKVIGFFRNKDHLIVSVMRRVDAENAVTFELIERFNLNCTDVLHAMNLDSYMVDNHDES